MADRVLEGKVVLMTGAGRGMGREMSLALAEAGAKVAMIDIDEDVLMAAARDAEAAGGQGCALPIVCDVTDADRAAATLDQILGRFGRLDMLVNDAVVGPERIGDNFFHDPPKFWELGDALWRQMLEVNVYGPQLMARTVVPTMLEAGRGRIVNVLGSSSYLASPYNSAYTTSKAALYSLTRSLAAATEEYGIGVFNYGPGLVRTELTEYMAGPDMPRPAAEVMAAALETDLRIEPEVSAEGVVYVASGKADAASGRYLDVRWGIAEMVARVVESGDDELYTLQLRK